jgi:hypothetical protein
MDDLNRKEPASDMSVARAAQASALGMFCAGVSALALLYSGDYIFFKLGKFNDVYKSIKVAIHPLFELIFDYGMAVWGILLIATVVSFDHAIRRPLDRRTLVLNVTVAIATIGFTCLLHHAAWSPIYNLLQGVGTP